MHWYQCIYLVKAVGISRWQMYILLIWDTAHTYVIGVQKSVKSADTVILSLFLLYRANSKLQLWDKQFDSILQI